jgi:secondary thiamine-phosphate synthase enzyme
MTFSVSTQGHDDIVNITDKLSKAVAESGVRSGFCIAFITGSTAALTTMENEGGIKKDLHALFERWAPEAADYEHHKKWGDHNGAAHMKHAIIGPDLAIPVEDGELALGTWQQAVLIDFDEKPRERTVVVQIITGT